MAYRRNVLDSYSYSKISCNNSKTVERSKRKYQNNSATSKRKRSGIKKENIKENVLINVERIITIYELNHNNYKIYDNNHYVDIDKLQKVKKK